MPQTMPPAPAATGDERLSRARAWSDYWASGALHSCVGSFSGNYAGAIAAFWQAVFDRLPQSAQVLDLCCGNAPLSKLLLDSHAKQVAGIVAADLAEISPPWLAGIAPELAARVRVHAGVDAAALPLPDAAFDLCMSQYGIEYAGEDAFREAARVLRPGARLAAVIHHVDSLPVRIARAELTHLDALLDADGLLARAAAMIEPMERAASEAGRRQLAHDAAANAARSAFNLALGDVQARIERGPFADVLIEQREALMALLATVPRIGVEAGQRAWEVQREALRAARLRQRELLEFACDAPRLQALAALLGDAAPSVDAVRFDNGELAGWGLLATRVG